jgi:hypothetical protein
MTGAEWYATIYAFNESPLTKGLLWAGSDDGLIHVSRDGGGSWDNVTPRAYGKFTRTTVIEPSHFDPGTAYVAATRYQMDDFKPYFWKTTDYGKTWTPIVSGIPANAYARTIREDPVRKGLLYAGTELGVFVSFNDGARWEPLQINLPRASVRDLRVHGSDLIAATHGRAFWVLDDIAPLRQLSDSVTARNAYLFQPSPAIRWVSRAGRSLIAGQNPRGGATFDYHLKTTPASALKLELRDASGTLIRAYSSEAAKTDTLKTPHDSIGYRTREAMKDSLFYQAADTIRSTRPGTNRFVWNLRYPGAKEMKNTLNDEGTLDGPLAVPGNYSVRLIVEKDTLVRQFVVQADPRVKSTTAQLARQHALVIQVRDRINDVVDGAVRIEKFLTQMEERVTQSKDQSFEKRVGDAVKPLRERMDSIRRELYEVHCHADQCSLDQPMKLYNQLLTINSQVQTGEFEPTRQHVEMVNEWSGKVGVQLRKLQGLEDTELVGLNRMLSEVQLPVIHIPARKSVTTTL